MTKSELTKTGKRPSTEARPIDSQRKDGGPGNKERAKRSVGKPSRKGIKGDGQPNAASGSTR